MHWDLSCSWGYCGHYGNKSRLACWRARHTWPRHLAFLGDTEPTSGPSLKPTCIVQHSWAGPARIFQLAKKRWEIKFLFKLLTLGYFARQWAWLWLYWIPFLLSSLFLVAQEENPEPQIPSHENGESLHILFTIIVGIKWSGACHCHMVGLRIMVSPLCTMTCGFSHFHLALCTASLSKCAHYSVFKYNDINV